MLLGPIFSSSCARCGGKWRISFWSLIVALGSMAAIPVLFVIGLVTQRFAPGVGGLFEVAALTIVTAAALLVYVVPVRKA